MKCMFIGRDAMACVMKILWHGGSRGNDSAFFSSETGSGRSHRGHFGLDLFLLFMRVSSSTPGRG